MESKKNTKRVRIQIEVHQLSVGEPRLSGLFSWLFSPRAEERQPVTVDLTAGYEVVKDHVILWMTEEETEPLRQVGFSSIFYNRDLRGSQVVDGRIYWAIFARSAVTILS